MTFYSPVEEAALEDYLKIAPLFLRRPLLEYGVHFTSVTDW